MANQFLKSITLEDGAVQGGAFVPIAVDDLPRPSPNPAGTYHVVTVNQNGLVLGGNQGGNVVTTFNTRTGDVTLSRSDVEAAAPVVETDQTNTFTVANFQCATAVNFNVRAGDNSGADAGNLAFQSGDAAGQGSGCGISFGGGKNSGAGGVMSFVGSAGVDETTGGDILVTTNYGGATKVGGQGGTGVEVADDFGSGAIFLGFYGAPPVARPTLTTGTGLTVDDVITALQTLGLVSN